MIITTDSLLSRPKLDYDGGYDVAVKDASVVVKDCVGRSEGLAIFWKTGVDVHVQGILRMYIDADVMKADGFLWRFTGFYGEPSVEKKDLSWRALCTLNAMRRCLWLCMGNFNEVLLAC